MGEAGTSRHEARRPRWLPVPPPRSGRLAHQPSYTETIRTASTVVVQLPIVELERTIHEAAQAGGAAIAELALRLDRALAIIEQSGAH